MDRAVVFVLSFLIHLGILTSQKVEITSSVQWTLFVPFRCDGLDICSVASPSTTLFHVNSQSQCVLACKSRIRQGPGCFGVNYRRGRAECDLFDDDPGLYVNNVTDCLFIQVFRFLQVIPAVSFVKH